MIRSNSFRHAGAILLSTIASLAFCTQLYALPSDRDQPISIESDRAEFRETDGVTLYDGNVLLTQGSILLRADRVEIYSSNEQVNLVVASGQQAYYEQLPSADATSKVVARGNRIEYRLDRDVIQLLENASLTQEGTTLTGNRILYDVREHVLRADSNTSPTDSAPESQPSTGGRVRVTLPPLGSGSD